MAVNIVVRSLWICLLALALPVQGFAAAQMMPCGPAHESMHDARMHAHEPAHDHGDQVALHAHADAAAQDPSSPLAQHSCSACAACCVGMALPSSAPVLAAPAESAMRDTAGGAAEPVFLTSGLERPPRPVLA